MGLDYNKSFPKNRSWQGRRAIFKGGRGFGDTQLERYLVGGLCDMCRVWMHGHEQLTIVLLFLECVNIIITF